MPPSIQDKVNERQLAETVKLMRGLATEFPRVSEIIDNFHRSTKPTYYTWKLKDYHNKSGKIEIITYDTPQMAGYTRKHKPERRENRTMANEKNAKRARRKVFEIVEANLTDYSKFITLTYAENMQDYDQLAHDFKMFIQNLKRKGYKFPYLWVVEKHDSEKTSEKKRGSLHVHALAFTDEYIPHEIIAKAWRHGFVKINAEWKKVDHKAAYVAKYIQKDTLPPDKKAYRTSRDIKRPTTKAGLGGLPEAMGVADIRYKHMIDKYTYSIPTRDTLVKWKTGEIVPTEEEKAAWVHIFENKNQ